MVQWRHWVRIEMGPTRWTCGCVYSIPKPPEFVFCTWGWSELVTHSSGRCYLPHLVTSNELRITQHRWHCGRPQRRTLFPSSTNKQHRFVPWNNNCSFAGFFFWVLREGWAATRALVAGSEKTFVWYHEVTNLYWWKGLRLVSDERTLKIAWTAGFCLLGCFQPFKNFFSTGA